MYVLYRNLVNLISACYFSHLRFVDPTIRTWCFTRISVPQDFRILGLQKRAQKRFRPSYGPKNSFYKWKWNDLSPVTSWLCIMK
jgi:hypothetical protein